MLKKHGFDWCEKHQRQKTGLISIYCPECIKEKEEVPTKKGSLYLADLSFAVGVKFTLKNAVVIESAKQPILLPSGAKWRIIIESKDVTEGDFVLYYPYSNTRSALDVGSKLSAEGQVDAVPTTAGGSETALVATKVWY